MNELKLAFFFTIHLFMFLQFRDSKHFFFVSLFPILMKTILNQRREVLSHIICLDVVSDIFFYYLCIVN